MHLLRKRRLFVSYRRRDASAEARALAEKLEAIYGRGNVFLDVDQPPGIDFVEAIGQTVAAADALIVIIGPDWLGRTSSDELRISDPQDHVRREVGAAIAQGVPVYPVFVRGASIPPPEALPEELRPLHRRNGISLNETSWRSDVVRLLDALPRPTRFNWRAAAVAVPLALAAAAVVGATLFVGGGSDDDEGSGDSQVETFARQVLERWHSQDYEGAWDLFHPGVKDTITLDRFTECEQTAGAPAVLISLRLYGIGGTRVEMEGVPHDSASAVSFTTTMGTPEGGQEEELTNVTVVREDDDLYWLPPSDEYAAYAAGECPEPHYPGDSGEPGRPEGESLPGDEAIKG